MNPRVAEILIHILRRVAEMGGVSDFPFEVMMEELIGMGFNPEDVRAALTWIADRSDPMGESPVEEAASPDSRRILHHAESHYLTPEARSMLAELQNAHLLQPGETEALIERAVWMERTHTSIDELRAFAQQMMLGQPHIEPGQEFRIVPGASSHH